MIKYRYPEERKTVLFFADMLNNDEIKTIIERGEVKNRVEARLLSIFFWIMVDKSATEKPKIPFDGSTQYWLEKLNISIGGYLERAGYEEIWDQESDNA